MSDGRLDAVWSVLERYVRGDRTDAELAEEARADPVLAETFASCLRCAPVAQELLEALDRTPFDDGAGPGPIPAPTRAGVVRWLERVRDGLEQPVSFCDWATDAFAWTDPDHPMDPLVQEILADLSGAEDDVASLAADPDRLEVVLEHLGREPDDGAADRFVVGTTAAAKRDELLIALVRRTAGEFDDDGLRAALRSALGPVATRVPTLIDELVARGASLSGSPDDLEAVERLLDHLARSGDAGGA